MRPSLLIALAAGLAGSAFAQSGSDSPSPDDRMPLGITREEARTLPAEALAERALHQVGTRLVAVTRPRASDQNRGESIYELNFATAPRSTGEPGLCSAIVVLVGRERPDEPPDRLSPSGIVATDLVYKVIGNVDQEPESTSAHLADQERRCAAAGPVIPADAADHWRPHFFTFRGSPYPTKALIALQRAIGGARSGAYSEVACGPAMLVGEVPECADPRRLLASLDLADLTALQVVALDQDARRYRIEATFALSAERDWELSLEARLPAPLDGIPTIELGPSRIDRGNVIDMPRDMPPPAPPGTP